MNYKKIKNIYDKTKVAAVSQVNLPTKDKAFAGLLVNLIEP
jgi:hypothetical protein